MNFNEPAGDTAPIDLHLPETFHRLKRTVLLLCSVLIVLGFATDPEKQTLTLTLIDIDLPVDVTRSLIWAAALYYLVGFGMEVRIVRLINSDAMLGAGMKTVDKAMEKLGLQLHGFERRMAELVTEAENHCTELVSSTFSPRGNEDYIRIMENKLGAMPAQNLTSLQHAMAQINSEIRDDTNKQAMGFHTLTSHVVRLTNSVTNFETESANLHVTLNKTHASINKLSTRILGDRKLSFWFWEIGGVLGAFVIATAINWPWMQRSWAWISAWGSAFLAGIS